MIAYRRTDSTGKSLIAIVSFSGAPNADIRIPAGRGKRYSVAFESTLGMLDGQDLSVREENGWAYVSVSVPPFGSVVLSEKSTRGRKIKLNSQN